MRVLNCKHCNGVVEASDKDCPHCGIPLPPDLAKAPQKKFMIWFVSIVIFCIIMMYWLPSL